MKRKYGMLGILAWMLGSCWLLVTPETCDDTFVPSCKGVVISVCSSNLVARLTCNSTCSQENADQGACPSCGNLITDSGEACDDGNTTSGDNCENDCTSPACGNFIFDRTLEEACDDGNTADNDGCSSTCKFEVCGDGIPQINEDCDDGNNSNVDGCSNECTAPQCGNNIFELGEECEDGNTLDADGCEGDCKLPACGNGIVDPGEFCFSQAQDFAVGDAPQDIAVGDFNGDGRPDIAVTNRVSPIGTVSILLASDAPGSFTAGTPLTAGNDTAGIAVADFNSDSKVDIAVTNFDSDNVNIFLGNGNGTFGPAASFDVGDTGNDNPNSIAVGDFDNNGTLDIATANDRIDNTVSILLGFGDGTFGAFTNFEAGGFSSSIVAADFNNNGTLDLAVANFDPNDIPNSNSNDVTVFVGSNDGNFSSPTNHSAQDGCNSIATADFNHSGTLDLAVANFGSNSVSVFLGNGTTSFGGAVNEIVGNSPFALVVEDFDNDGNQDIAVSNNGSNNLSVLLGNGDGTFEAPRNFAIGITPRGVAVGDFNEDSRLDFAVSNSNAGGTVSVLLSSPP
jgi:cysteine-rich repeat protein